MFADLRAVYGTSPAAITELSTRYGATHLWIRRHAVARGARWRPRQLPYGRYVHDLLRGGEPASLRLPAACRQWRRGSAEVYDLACVSSARHRAAALVAQHATGVSGGRASSPAEAFCSSTLTLASA